MTGSWARLTAPRNTSWSSDGFFFSQRLEWDANGAAIWGLSAIMNLALIGDSLESARAKAPPETERTDRPGSS